MNWFALNLRGMQAAFSAFAEAAEGRLLRFEELIAVVNPAVAARSVFNSVVYTDPDALIELDGVEEPDLGEVDWTRDGDVEEMAARGKGLATALMRKAIYDAGRRGQKTSTLQATKLGAPVYRRCGYADFGALQMWETRPAALASEAHPGAHA